jgi:surfeit locus 1 family protein
MSGRRPVGLAVLAGVVAVLCLGLGRWQLGRRVERRAANAAVAARRALPPLVVTGAGLTADSAWQRRVALRGVYDHERERVFAGRSVDGVPGASLLTPLRLADGAAVFVDRGWVPSPDARGVDRALTREADSAAFVGLALRAPRARGDVDPAALADSVPYALVPFLVQRLPDDGAYAPTRVPVRRWPAPPLDDGPHLMYAVQWFAFAAIAIGGMIAVLRRR